MYDVQAAPEWFGIRNLYGAKPAGPQVSMNRNLGKKCKTKAASHHLLGGLNAIHFVSNIWHEARASKQGLSEGPVAGPTLKENQREPRHVLKPNAPRRPAVGSMSRQHQWVFAQSNRLNFRVYQRPC